MTNFDAATIARLVAGEVDYLDGLTLFLPSGNVSLLLGALGQFEWTDTQIGTQTFYGTGDLVRLDVPPTAFGSEASSITATFRETYLPEGGGDPVNIFANGSRNSIDDEAWQGALCVLSEFWRDQAGTILHRRTVDIRQLDDLPVRFDDDGNTIRTAILERPEIRQRQIEGKKVTPQFQNQIDASDTSLKHLNKVKNQKIKFGRRTNKSVGSA